jgi:RNA polymerase sigma-70 factor (ECF subfamily)
VSNDDLTRAVERAQAGDETAMRQLVAEYDSPMRRIAHNVVHDREDAHDAVQEAWVVVVRRLSTLHDPARFPAWLYRIVVRCATRRRQAGASYGKAIARLMAATPRDAAAPDPDDRPLPVAAALHVLTQKESLVVGLRYFSGVAVNDIARLLGIPPGTVKSRLHQARQRLGKELTRMANSTDTHTPQEFRKVIAGNQGEIHWNTMFDASLDGWYEPVIGQPAKPVVGVPEGWEIVGDDGLVGEEYAGGVTLLFGEPSWHHVEFSALVTPLAGGNAQFLIRADDEGAGWYTFDLMLGWQVAALHKMTRMDKYAVDLTRLSAVNYPLEYAREYAVSVAARGQSITTYIDGALVNQVTDDTWRHGRVALNIWHSKTLYRDMRYRVLDEH